MFLGIICFMIYIDNLPQYLTSMFNLTTKEE